MKLNKLFLKKIISEYKNYLNKKDSLPTDLNETLQYFYIQRKEENIKNQNIYSVDYFSNLEGFSYICDINEKYIKKIFHGEKNPTFIQIIKMAFALNLSVFFTFDLLKKANIVFNISDEFLLILIIIFLNRNEGLGLVAIVEIYKEFGLDILSTSKKFFEEFESLF